MPADGQPGRGLRAVLRQVCRSWLDLTVEEQRALAIVVGLFLLGVTVRLWHACR